MDSNWQPITPAKLEWDGNTPAAPDFGDHYFSRGQGLAESEAVFIQGNHLTARFAALPADGLFVIGETGFGTGLNLLLAADCFDQHAPASARLQLMSVERHPLKPSDLERACSHWPELATWSQALLAQYPAPVPGLHRIRLLDRVELILMLGDAAQVWSQSTARVDAWFLDGFAPDRNPSMWQAALFKALAERSRPGATLATFSVAGAVRNGLADAGFALDKKPGFGRKRHRLEGQWPGSFEPQRYRTGTALVAGAGVAGATTARALAERGWQVTVVDAAGVAQGASGNRTGVVYTTPSAHPTPQNRFYQLSYLNALRWMRMYGAESNGIGRFNGVVQHLVTPDKQAKMRAALDSGFWPESLLESQSDQLVVLKGGGYLQPVAWCELLFDHPGINLHRARIADWVANGLRLDSGEQLTADHTVLCLAGNTQQLTDLDWLPIRRIRGQVSYCAATEQSAQWTQAECHRGYLTPAVDGLHCVGASFNLHEHDPAPNPADDRANLDQLRQHLPQRWQQLGGETIEIVDRRVGFRCQSNDYLPIVGALVDARGEAQVNLWLNLAHGSRGIGGTPLCAELLADRICDHPIGMDQAMIDAISPGRFATRKRRRNRRQISSRVG